MKKILTVEGGKRAAYVPVLGKNPDEYIVALCVEGDVGYRPLDDLYMAGPKDEIFDLVKILNDRIGLTDEEVAQIAMGAMKPRVGKLINTPEQYAQAKATIAAAIEEDPDLAQGMDPGSIIGMLAAAVKEYEERNPEALEVK